MRALRSNGLIGSMGRTGTCADNAAMESFFSLLQKNVLDRRRWSSRQELRLAITYWIERTYHRRRRQRGLGKLTPIEFETILRSLMRPEVLPAHESTGMGADPTTPILTGPRQVIHITRLAHADTLAHWCTILDAHSA